MDDELAEQRRKRALRKAQSRGKQIQEFAGYWLREYIWRIRPELDLGLRHICGLYLCGARSVDFELGYRMQILYPTGSPDSALTWQMFTWMEPQRVVPVGNDNRRA